MITNKGTITLSQYKRLEKRHGADKSIGIFQRIIDTLEQENLLRSEVSNKIVKERSQEIYENIANDYASDLSSDH
tara:strand:+ start:2844 stop:3068 length:225 start_codon:yes stop_codon:yes gene_type:complete